MAQINITLSQEELLQVLSGNREEAFKLLLGKILNQIMLAESAEQLGADRHERTAERQDYRNGFRERSFNTRIGTITLDVPRHRNQPFHTMIFENYSRSEASLLATMVQMVIEGVSTRKVSRVVETLCGTSFSKSTVSELCKSLDAEITAFRTRPLEDLEAPFLMVDATYFKVRENHRVVGKAFLTGIAIHSDGTREVVGFNICDGEDRDSWLSFFKDLKSRGLHGVRMVISDGHKSILRAISKTFPKAAWQRCQVHFHRNIMDETPKKWQKGLSMELRQMFTAETLDEAIRIRDEIISDYESVAPKAMTILENGFDDSMVAMLLPVKARKYLRSTNMIERMNREFKRRSDVIQVFPNTASIMRLMGAVAIEYSDAFVAKELIFSTKAYTEFQKTIFPKFEKIANTQQALLEAA